MKALKNYSNIIITKTFYLKEMKNAAVNFT